jgi:hypothetical protein
LQRLPVRGGAFDVLPHTIGYALRLLLGDLSYGLGGDADYEAMRWKFLVFSDQRASSDYGTLSYLRPVEDGGAHAYEAAVFNLAAVDYGVVADYAIVADDGGVAGVGVHHAAVLDVGARNVLPAYRLLLSLLTPHEDTKVERRKRVSTR